ncbi:MAG: acyl-CoA dehydrogenase family protein [Acidimicrobiales bacterium]
MEATPVPSQASAPHELAGRIANEVLFPTALATDGADTVPPGHLDRLAAAGLYGAAGPGAAGGLGLDGAPFRAVVEALAGGCLATTFVWVQHHRLVRALARPDAPAALRDEWLRPLCGGERRAGVALGGLLPGPPRLAARRTADGWALDGESPWVTGWGMVDVLLVAARGPGGAVVWLVMDAAADGRLTAERRRLVAVDASATVRLAFDGVEVPAARLLRIDAPDAAEPVFAAALRTNGSLALGVAGRCCRLMGPSALDDALDACRRRLDEAEPAASADVRAEASDLALRAASALVVHAGSRSVASDEHPQRLAREAIFLLVFGSRPPIRAALLKRLAGGRRGA